MKNVKFDKPVDLVLKIENICSLLFSFNFFSISVLVMITVLYTPMILIESLILKNFHTYILIYMSIVSIPTIIILSLKNPKLKHKLQNNLINNISYTFLTNAGNVLSIGLFTLSILISIPLSYSQLNNFNYKNYDTDKNQINLTHVKDNENYIDERNNKLRIQKATIESYELKNDLRIFISWYKSDDITLQKANELSSLFLKVNENITNDTIDLNSIFNPF